MDTTNDSSRERALSARTKILLERFNGSPPSNPLLLSLDRDNNGHSLNLHNRDMSIDLLDHDNAFLHFDSELDPSNIPSKTPKKSRAVTKSTLYIKTKNTPKRMKTAARMQSSLDVETVESLELLFKDKISQDTDLHLRILRYEVSHRYLKDLRITNANPVRQPIHFDVFLKLMLGDSFSSASGKARLRMRSLLDKQVCVRSSNRSRKALSSFYILQAIHFYGSEEKNRRRRR